MHKAAKHVRAGQSATTHASRQSWREPTCRQASICSFAVFSKSTKKSKSARPNKKLRPQAAGDARRIRALAQKSFQKFTFLPLKKRKLPSHHDFIVFAEKKLQHRLLKPFVPYQIGEQGGTANKNNGTKQKQEGSVRAATAAQQRRRRQS